MSDEYDDSLDHLAWQRDPVAATTAAAREAASTPRLVARLYRSSNAPLRAKLLECLLRPLGTLSLAAVSAGAFAAFVGRSPAREVFVTLEEVARFSSAQILELACFVEQVSPQAMQQVADLLSENAVGLATFGASAALLLLRRLGVGVGGA